MMLVLGLDPGAAGAGYAVWDAWEKRHIYIGTEAPTGIFPDAIVVESGFIGKMGRQAMWGLGFDAGWRLCELGTRSSAALFTIRPDGALGWRAALPSLPGAHQKYDGLPGDVIVARLRFRYGFLPSTLHTEHEIEACGIAEAAAAILARPKVKDRRALKAVKR